MAKELAHFQNFAKLKDTEVAFNDITVIAGKPGTGKSYVMKFMYAIDEAFYRKTNNILSIDAINSNRENLSFYADFFLKEDKVSFAYQLLNENKFDEYQHLLLNNLKKETPETLKKLLGKAIYEIQMYEDMPLEEQFILFLSNLVKSIFIDYSQISDSFSIDMNNLQLSNVDADLEFNFKNILSKSNQTVIFVETPLILEFKKFMKKEKGKTPYHIESFLNILDTDYSFTDKEQDKFIKSFRAKAQDIIGGDIESSGDSFIFNGKDDKNYDILNASSGTKSIGLLQYLVTNKALKKGSVLYWEEPEVHLHPEWQLKMIDLFVELMNAGVKIVFSTHSPYMPDYLNAISKRRGFADRVSFNLFKETKGVVENHILDTEEKWQMIQDELLGSLEEIMWEYV